MNSILDQFHSEARELLQSISEKLLKLEKSPGDADLMNELFRLVHTLKGISGLFDFPEMTRVLHVGEDLMDEVRNGKVAFSQDLADKLLNAMDFVSLLCDEIDTDGNLVFRPAECGRMTDALRGLITNQETANPIITSEMGIPVRILSHLGPDCPIPALPFLEDIPETILMEACRCAQKGESIHWISYTPDKECFFRGNDPFFTVRQTPGLLWGRIATRESWPPLPELDLYSCMLGFHMLAASAHGNLHDHYRYAQDQVHITKIEPLMFVIPHGDPNGGLVYEDFVSDALHHLGKGDLPALRQAAITILELSNPDLWQSSALRWLLLLLEISPNNPVSMKTVHALVVSIRTQTPPDLTDQNPRQKSSGQIVNPPPAVSERCPIGGECVYAIEDPDIYTDFMAGFKRHLEKCEKEILSLEQTSEITIMADDFFRVFHTLKNASDMLGLPETARLAEETELLLAAIRAKRLVFTSEIMDLVPVIVGHFKMLMDNLDAQISGKKDILIVLVPIDTTIAKIKRIMDNCSASEQTNTARDMLGDKNIQTTDHPSPLSEEDTAALKDIISTQRQILMIDDKPAWFSGRLKAVACSLINCCKATYEPKAQNEIEAALDLALSKGNGSPLIAWLDDRNDKQQPATQISQKSAQTKKLTKPQDDTPKSSVFESPGPATVIASSLVSPPTSEALNETPKFGRRAEDTIYGTKVLKVDQSKIDRLMNLIGEMVVSKNALPYLAQRAENQYGVRELSREIKAQYTIINRIAEEMQDSIMQVCMMPVSFVFQRFPRLVRDLSRKLGKEVQLVLNGEETEADKNIIESLADPLIHILRNSLDHGLETPEVRRACGKPATGTITIRATQEADRVIIEIIDDGRGIDPSVIKRKAYEKGVIDEAALERISDREAINLIFSPGFSTAEAVSDLSGRGVGMDVVREAVAKVNGVIALESNVGKGTLIRISLPLSMAVTKVMIIESDGQIFGVPMDHVVETVRVPRTSIHKIKQSQTTVLRGRIVPLKSLNSLLNVDAENRVNADDKLAMLVVRVDSQVVGLLVDDFRETVDVIQKPLNGVLSGLGAYSGSALMGDGSVLMVLNLKEIV